MRLPFELAIQIDERFSRDTVTIEFTDMDEIAILLGPNVAPEVLSVLRPEVSEAVLKALDDNFPTGPG